MLQNFQDIDYEKETMLNLLQKSNDASVIEIEIDKVYSANCDELKQGLEPYLQKNIRVYLSLRKVSFMDSSGIGLLISTLRKLIQNNSELFLTDCQPSVLALFELVKLNKVVNILPNDSEIKV